ncbi:MAG: lipid A biosynthesis lauroyl acyltransferase [Xanthobacteraceae bacterium]|nr:lipid A biosynthesis lauroyl acyltransferase [Xanthobacteraceae bacterium]
MNGARKILRKMMAAVRPAAEKVAGASVLLLLRGVRRLDRVKVSNFAARLMRNVGPLLPEHRIGRANLKAAFPEKSDAEIEAILRGVWDNIGRVTVEFAHIDRLAEGDPWHRTFIDYDAGSIERFLGLREDGKPALVFAAHLGNWELPALISAADGLETSVLYRRPNLGAVADAIFALRAGQMGELVPTSMFAPIQLARALEAGRHVAMLVDQHYGKGVEVTFFGRPCLANPLMAVLAREAECAIHGTRVIRIENGRFRAEVTEPIVPVRDAEGKIDVQGTMQAITSVIESWVREYPDQWLWLHRRWR